LENVVSAGENHLLTASPKSSKPHRMETISLVPGSDAPQLPPGEVIRFVKPSAASSLVCFNLPHATLASQLMALFAPFGLLYNVTVKHKDRTMMGETSFPNSPFYFFLTRLVTITFAFIHYYSTLAAKDAYRTLQGADFLGHPLRVRSNFAIR